MNNAIPATLSYFPGCSLATTARENNSSLVAFCRTQGIELIELEDWSCCGSSSAHSINRDMACSLAERNLSLAPPDRPLLVACPSCMLRLSQAQLHLKTDAEAAGRYERMWGKAPNRSLEIIHFFELLEHMDLERAAGFSGEGLRNMRIVPYYGCMLSRPPEMRREKNYHGLMEKVLTSLGADVVQWAYSNRCCGTFLSVVRPDVVTPMVNEIMDGAISAGADCMVTACAMCHMNLEIRCNLQQKVPIFHFSEILSLAVGAKVQNGWFSRHLIDPRPLLRKKQMIA
ncbi:MAG: heterodisulfide reductase subunit B [Desulfobacteraceae bacterium]|nr:heterodisulfide reductase subunit B [Desulfobacteraceae bacterium]